MDTHPGNGQCDPRSQRREILAAVTTRELKKVFPDEYGAWAMWIVPFLSGAQLAHAWNGKTLLWFLFLVLFYVLKNPFVEWMIKSPVLFRPEKDRQAMILIASVFPLVVVAGGGWFFSKADRASAIWVTILAAIFTGAYLLLDIRKLGRSLVGQWVGVFLLALTAPLTTVALGGAFDWAALAVWLANSLYFAHSIYTVRGWMNSRRREGQRLPARVLFRPLFLYWAGVLTLTALAISQRWIPASWAILLLPTTIFIAVFVGGLFRKITIRQIGLLEVAHTTIFTVLLLYLI